MTYKDYLQECHRNELIDLAFYFKSPYTLDELEEMSLSELRDKISPIAFGEVATWIHDLTLNDLQMLKLLIEDGCASVIETPQLLPAEKLGIIYIDEEGDEGYEDDEQMRVCDDIGELVAPLLDDAIMRKQQSGEDVMETALYGVLNIMGCIKLSKATELLCRLLPDHDARLAPQAIAKFLTHSIIVRVEEGLIDENNEIILYANIQDDYDWEFEIRDVEPYEPNDINEILAHGTYPYFTPTRQCERDFCRLLENNDYSPEEVLCELTFSYSDLQNVNIRLSRWMGEMINSLALKNMDEANEAARVLAELNNGIPKFILKGNSSRHVSGMKPSSGGLVSDMFTEMKKYASESPAPINDFPMPIFPMRKVSRNDPCPCGSGKKYKNCCGMEN